MEQFRQLGQTCRQHYEKLVLSAALLIFAVAVYFLYEDSIRQREAIRNIPKGFDNLPVHSVRPASLAANDAALKQAERPPVVELVHPHFLYNPLQWESRGGGPPTKLKTGNETGPNAMQIVRIKPLHLTIAYSSVSTSGVDADAVVSGYWLAATNELFALRHPKRLSRAYLAPNDGKTNNPIGFVLTAVKGDPKEPTELIGELREPPVEHVIIAPGRPYQLVLGYEAELRYQPAPTRPYVGLRVGAPVTIDTRTYKVVDIDPTQVLLSADSNGQTYRITKFVP
jgi:hypothetical protein